MIDETRNVHIKDFAGLKSKLYAFMIKDIHESNKTKGINKNNVDDELKFKDYKSVQFKRLYMRHEMNRIRSIIQNCTELIKFLSPLTMTKKHTLQVASGRKSLFHKSTR